MVYLTISAELGAFHLQLQCAMNINTVHNGNSCYGGNLTLRLQAEYAYGRDCTSHRVSRCQRERVVPEANHGHGMCERGLGMRGRGPAHWPYEPDSCSPYPSYECCVTAEYDDYLPNLIPILRNLLNPANPYLRSADSSGWLVDMFG